MKKRFVKNDDISIAVINSDEIIISDSQSALDLIATVSHVDGCQSLIINKEAIIDDFFDLSSGIAGEILQKFVNYSMRMAIIGDFSEYTSKALKNFIYECNHGIHIFFVSNEQAAIAKLAE